MNRRASAAGWASRRRAARRRRCSPWCSRCVIWLRARALHGLDANRNLRRTLGDDSNVEMSVHLLQMDCADEAAIDAAIKWRVGNLHAAL